MNLQRPLLPPPARYFPLDKGVYEVAPGLSPLTRSFGNGPLDQQVFQITKRFPDFHENKLRCREERLEKYVQRRNLPEATSTAVNRFILERLLQEHPELFHWKPLPSGGVLECLHTGARIHLDSNFELAQSSSPSAAGGDPAGYQSAFDALCLQFESDRAVMQVEADGNDWLAQIHLCAPSHWAAEEKIGQPFTAIHAPIPHIEKVNAAARGLVNAMIFKGPYVRFVWGFATDDRLNHHPVSPPGFSAAEWRGRSFNASRTPSPFLLRVERQVTFGLPAVQAALFGIHVSFIEGEAIRNHPKERELLTSALRSLSPESRIYKSVEGSLESVLEYLSGH